MKQFSLFRYFKVISLKVRKVKFQVKFVGSSMFEVQVQPSPYLQPRYSSKLEFGWAPRLHTTCMESVEGSYALASDTGCCDGVCDGVAALGRDDGEGGVWCGNREDSWIGVWLAGTAAPCIALSGDVSPDGLTLAFVDGPWEVGKE